MEIVITDSVVNLLQPIISFLSTFWGGILLTKGFFLFVIVNIVAFSMYFAILPLLEEDEKWFSDTSKNKRT